MTFFWRIFLSGWAIFLITVIATLWVASYLPDSGNGARNARFPEQMVDLIAGKLHGLLEVEPTSAAKVLAEEQALDFSPLLEIYVLDPNGNDILGRALPKAVADVVRLETVSAEDAQKERPTHLHIREQGLRGYQVVGDEGYFLLSGLATKPGGRGMLILIMVVVSASVSFILARFIVLPVRRLQRAGQKVADGDLTVRVAPFVGSRTDDIARLARGFDQMTERVDALLRSQQRLMRDVSHELRSPLARLQALLSIARQNSNDADSVQLDRMEVELERLDELIGEILAYTRLEAKASIERHPTDLVDLIQNIVEDACLEGTATQNQICMEAPERCVVALDSGLIQRAVENVVRNAMRYTAEGTAVEISIVKEAQCVRVLIKDRGPGVPEKVIEDIFKPFFRVGDSGSAHSGTGGIGLAIAERSIRLHDGTIKARNRKEGGLCVEIVLPGNHIVQTLSH